MSLEFFGSSPNLGFIDSIKTNQFEKIKSHPKRTLRGLLDEHEVVMSSAKVGRPFARGES
jgi:hypothetical protein